MVANCGSVDCDIDNYSNLTTINNNWFEDATCGGTADGDPLLGMLSDNGGFTETPEPQHSSGLISNANLANCPSTDQLGELRNVGGDDELFFPIKVTNGNVVVISFGGNANSGQCDIGSVETSDAA